MAWYYYSGNTPVPVPVKPGASVSVRRGSKVEVLMDSKELQALIREGKLKKTSAPKGQRGSEEIKTPSVAIKDVVKKTKFSDTFVELGAAKPVSEVQPIVEDTKVDHGNQEDDVQEEAAGSSLGEEDLDKDENDGEKEIAKDAVLLEDVKGKIGKRRKRQGNTE